VILRTSAYETIFRHLQLWNREDAKSAKTPKKSLCDVFASLRLCVFNAVAVSSNIEEAEDSGIVALIS